MITSSRPGIWATLRTIPNYHEVTSGCCGRTLHDVWGLSSVCRRSASTKSKSSILLGQLPRQNIDKDGHPIGPLAPFDLSSKARSRRRGRGSKDTAIDLQIAGPPTSTDPRAEYKAAVARGEVPDTALSEQVYQNWKRFPDAILLTRVGKFYESYFAPAIELSSLLSLKLAYKKYSGGNFPFSGFPVHQSDKYLKILVQDLGRTVVLVEEYDEEGRKEGLDPIRKVSSSTELKDRRVGRVVTPGTLVEEGWAGGDESRYLLAISVGTPASDDSEAKISLAYTDPSTGEFFTRDTTTEFIEDDIARIAPREVVLDTALKASWSGGTIGTDRAQQDLLQLLRVLGVYVSFADPERSPTQGSNHTILGSVPVPAASLEVQAINLLRHHLQYALRDSMPDLSTPSQQSASKTMLIDAATLSALEIRHAIRLNGLASSIDSFGRISPLSTRGTLVSTIAQTMTPSGHRLLIRTLTAPSTDLAMINARLDLVGVFVEQEELRTDLRDMIRGISDVMRILQRFKGRRGDGRDAWDMALWVRSVDGMLARIKQETSRSGAIAGASAEHLLAFVDNFKPLIDLAELIERSVDEIAVMKQAFAEQNEGDEGDELVLDAGDAMLAESPKKKGETNKGRNERERKQRDASQWWMKPSFSSELQDMHAELERLKSDRIKLEKDLRKKLKIDKLHLTKIRNTFVMTISAKLDFAKIDKLRQFADISEGRSGKHYAYNPWSALGARIETHIEDMLFAQRRAFDQLRDMIVERAEEVQHNAALMDELDLSMSFAQTASDLDYVRPELNNSTDLEIIDGRHPTVESSLLSSSRAFTPNSTHMDPSSHLHIITGPNQGGKSTFLRQTAVIAILAQSGSFVPASRVKMGVVDRVFSRIGARDDLFRDRSTFMLEMVETAAILRHATDRSLVIMDEIGRGTTLHSGLSIAYATLNHIIDNIKCRTLFATHYHEVADMLSAAGDVRAGVQFWCTDVDEVDGAFSYQYRLVRGINHRSHAIKAARLAGMPESFLRTAEKILAALDAGSKPTEAVSVSSKAGT